MYTSLYNGSRKIKPESKVLSMKSNLYYGMGKIKLSCYMLL